MHKIISHNTVFPTAVIPGDPENFTILDNFMELKPKPEKDVLLILGDASNVLDDVGRWYDLAEGIVEYDTMAVNYSALIAPHPIQHYAAGDAHMRDMQRIAQQLPKGVVRHAWNAGCPGFDIRWARNGRGGWSGTSTNLAVKVGLAMDYKRKRYKEQQGPPSPPMEVVRDSPKTHRPVYSVDERKHRRFTR